MLCSPNKQTILILSKTLVIKKSTAWINLYFFFVMYLRTTYLFLRQYQLVDVDH